MKRSILLVVLSCPLHFLVSSQEVTSIIPTPQQVTTKPAKFKITSSTKVVLGTGTSREDGFAASQVNHQLAEMKGPYVKTVDEESLRRFAPNFVYIGTPESERGKEFLKERIGRLTKEMREEGYFLDVTMEGVVIIAHSATGRFYGVMSLLQLIEREKKSLVVP
ncbi:MAG: glycoside hydrolase family 20 zincin-like fold domain-containing protein, partial [Bacteroidota bacterium]